MKTLALLLTLLLAPWAGAEFKAGAAFRVITPDPLLPISGGVGIPRPVKEKKGDLFARALVIDNGQTRVALVSVDNIGIPSTLADKARAQVKGISPDNILIGVTHTHSAPDAYGFPDGKGGHTADLAYLDMMCAKIAEAVNEAQDKLQPAGVRIATGEIADGIAWNSYAPALFDKRCNVLQAVATSDGKVIATLVNYAVHPEVLGPRMGILSPDLCGPLYDRIEAKVGGMAMFMNSAQGGMVTADNRDPKGGKDDVQTWEECQRIGNLLADEALRVIADAPVQQEPALYFRCEQVKFPVDSEMMRGLVKGSPIMTLNEDNTVSTRMCLMNLGTAQLLSIPGEALPNIGAYLKRKMPGDHDFLLGLTNDAFGYMLTPEDFESFERYEYISRTSLGERTGRILEKNAMKLIKAAPEPASDPR